MESFIHIETKYKTLVVQWVKHFRFFLLLDQYMAQVIDDLRSNGTRKNPFTKMKMESLFHIKTKSITSGPMGTTF
jgi:hypothetical protein